MGCAEKRFLSSVASYDTIVADVGANQGLYTLWLAQVATGGHIYAFEPDPDLFQCLENNVRTNHLQNVSTIQAAASDRSGTLAFRTNELNRGDNRVDAKAFRDTSTQQVQAVTLDEIVSDRRLDLLKIDVQGFEIEVLLGAQKTLKANPAVTIVFEFWPYGLRQAGHRPNELWDLLQEAGFSIAALVSARWQVGRGSAGSTPLGAKDAVLQSHRSTLRATAISSDRPVSKQNYPDSVVI
jgi:FkbM family methyltransferase